MKKFLETTWNILGSLYHRVWYLIHAITSYYKIIPRHGEHLFPLYNKISTNIMFGEIRPWQSKINALLRLTNSAWPTQDTPSLATALSIPIIYSFILELYKKICIEDKEAFLYSVEAVLTNWQSKVSFVPWEEGKKFVNWLRKVIYEDKMMILINNLIISRKAKPRNKLISSLFYIFWKEIEKNEKMVEYIKKEMKEYRVGKIDEVYKFVKKIIKENGRMGIKEFKKEVKKVFGIEIVDTTPHLPKIKLYYKIGRHIVESERKSTIFTQIIDGCWIIDLLKDNNYSKVNIFQEIIEQDMENVLKERGIKESEAYKRVNKEDFPYILFWWLNRTMSMEYVRELIKEEQERIDKLWEKEIKKINKELKKALYEIYCKKKKVNIDEIVSKIRKIKEEAEIEKKNVICNVVDALIILCDEIKGTCYSQIFGINKDERMKILIEALRKIIKRNEFMKEKEFKKTIKEYFNKLDKIEKWKRKAIKKGLGL